MPHQLFAGEFEQVRVLARGLAIPGLETRAGADVGRQLLVVEGVDQLVVHQHVLPARLVFQLFHLGDELLVGSEERQARLPLPAHQRLADEDLARGMRIDLAEVDATVVVDDQAVERGPLQRRDLRGLLLPVRVQQLFLEQVAADLLDPLRLDGSDAPAEEPRCLDQLGRDDPAPGLLVQVGARVLVELDAARAQIPVFLVALGAHVAQQAREHREVDLLVAGGGGVELPAVLGHHREQLGVDVAPLAQAADADEVLPQQRFVLAVAELVGGLRCRGRIGGLVRSRQALGHGQAGLGARALPGGTLGSFFLRPGRRQAGRAAARLVDPLPELEVAAEFALLVVELGMRLVGLLLRLQRAVAHVLHRQRRGDHQHLLQRLALARLQDHAAHARVERQARQLHAHGRELVGVVHRAQFAQQLVAVGDGAARRRLDERELRHIAQVQRLHAQDDAGQRRAQDFRIGEARAAVEVCLVVEADADAVRHAPATAGALVGGRLAHRLDQQLLHLATETVALDPCRTCVDDVTDARHGERGLGHVGGQHDAPPGVAFEDAVLLGLRQAGEERQHLGIAHHWLVGEVLAQMVGGLADLALAGQEDQDVAARIAGPEFIHAVGDGFVQAVVAAVLEGTVALLHRKGAPGDVNHGSRPLGRFEVLGEPVRVDGGRGDDDLQIGPARQDLAQVAQQEVDVQAALVGLVDDERVVGLEQRVGLRFGQQNAVGHQLDRGALGEPVLEAHLVAHHLAQGRLQLFRDALGHAAGGDAARLGVADELAFLARAGIAPAPAQGQRDLGQLGGLAGAGFAAHDDDLVLPQGRHDLVALARDGQGFGEFDAQRGRGGRKVGRRGFVHEGLHYPSPPPLPCGPQCMAPPACRARPRGLW